MRRGFMILEAMLIAGIIAILVMIVIVAIKSPGRLEADINCLEESRGRCCIEGHEELNPRGEVQFICDMFIPLP